MPSKSRTYAMFEAIAQVMGESKNAVYLAEGGTGTAGGQGLTTIDLKQVLDSKGEQPLGTKVTHAGIDEVWYAAAALGSSLVGLKGITRTGMYMSNALTYDLISMHAAKIPYMSGFAGRVPAVFVIPISGQGIGHGAQHADYMEDSLYMALPGVKVVIPSTHYDAKGLMVAALKSPDPVVFLEASGAAPGTGEVPDEVYEVPIGKCAIRTEGSDITIVSSGSGMAIVAETTARLQSDGVSVESIDLRTLAPLDRKTLVESVQKTKRLLTVDQGKFTLCPGAEVIATCAQGVPGARFHRLAFPDAPPPASPEQFNYMKPNADEAYKAAKALLQA